MKLTMSKLRKIIREELYNPQSDDATFKKGILVKDVNPDCPHHNSMGTVTEVSGKEVTYEVENIGRTYQPGDVLTKTKEQLIPLNAENIKSLSEMKLKNMIPKQRINEKYKDPDQVAGDLVGVVDELRSQLKRVDFNKLREWAKKHYRSAPALLDMLDRTLKIFKKLRM
tara:strand:+ start:289 stop:795 length:507 start_codon:yes stop_codon:yes gene_type:complete